MKVFIPPDALKPIGEPLVLIVSNIAFADSNVADTDVLPVEVLETAQKEMRKHF